MSKKPTLIYCGHHKCASTWIEDICFYVCSELKLNFGVVYNSQDFNFDLQSYIDEKQLDFIAYANADYQYVKRLRNYRGFHVVRDPKDIVVSAYFSHLHSHATHAWPELLKYREKLQAQTKRDGLFSELDFFNGQYKEMMSWPDRDENIMSIKMEDLTSDAYKVYVKIFDFLGLLYAGKFDSGKRIEYFLNKVIRRIEKNLKLDLKKPMGQLPVERLLGIVWEHEFSKISGGRNAGAEDIKNHYRKGVAGDWVNHMESDHIAYFKERYGDILTKYGYLS